MAIRKLRPFKFVIGILLLALLTAAVLVIREELQTSAYQARFFADLARPATYQLGPGPSPAIRFPDAGPYDKRLGYAGLPDFLAKLQKKNFDIQKQSRMSERMVSLNDYGFFIPYREKTQAGLTLFDQHRQILYKTIYPEHIYVRFEDIPPILIQSLLFIENRELLDTQYPHRNPAVEWTRLSRAIYERALQGFNAEERTPGGSTLATQIEKYRHSPEGRTNSIRDKLRQMVSAALRVYQSGEDTTEARRQIVLEYLNTMPLSAKPGFGEINGMGDGLQSWYGREFGEANRVLASINGHADEKDDGLASDIPSDLPVTAKIYKQALSLIISQRRPSYYLTGNENELEDLTNSYLRLLASAGVISTTLSEASQKTRLGSGVNSQESQPVSFVARKASTSVRTQLSSLLGVSRFYDLDRFDLSVATTLDMGVQNAVTQVLRDLREPDKARAAGLHEKQLLDRGDPSKVIYSLTLYERGDDANFLRVQTDNFDQPFDVNMGTKLDLGSTAKLRTLVSYLEIVADLHQRYGSLDPSELRAIAVDPKDHISKWAIEYLAKKRSSAVGLREMLDAALDRRYSSSSGESFFTGGGIHTFQNFSRDDNGQIISVRDGLRNSVNLVFIRLMRDIVYHYMFQTPGSSARLLRDASDPRRTAYLMRFADQEGRVFIQRFFRKYQRKSQDEIDTLLLQGMRLTPSRLASAHRSIEPNAQYDSFVAFLKKNLPANLLVKSNFEKLYSQYDPKQMSLADRGYVAGIHPLELWLISYLRTHPKATLAQVFEASTNERQMVYSWLFNTHRKYAQDKRIRGLLEVEGFLEIHRHWKRLGYPFDSLVPSYATALGASADRPAALAELMGIIVNDGVRKPNTLIESLHFASGTPYDTRLRRQLGRGEQVLPKEVAQATRAALLEVVANGTAKRIKSAYTRSDGSVIPIGGKTGTGDHRFDVYSRGGHLVESRVVNRSATFVFNIGERFFWYVDRFRPGCASRSLWFHECVASAIDESVGPKLDAADRKCELIPH